MAVAFGDFQEDFSESGAGSDSVTVTISGVNGSDLCVIVGGGARNDNVDSATWEVGGTPTAMTVEQKGDVENADIGLFSIAGGDETTVDRDAVVAFSGTGRSNVCAAYFTGVDQDTPTENSNQAETTGDTTLNLAISSNVDDMVCDWINIDQTHGADLVIDETENEIFAGQNAAGSNRITSGMGWSDGASTVTSGWNWVGGEDEAIITAVSMIAAGVGGGNRPQGPFGRVFQGPFGGPI